MILSRKSDFLGAALGSLCLIHCVATPFLFVVQTCATDVCCPESPVWWRALDYVFIVITFFAAYQSGKNTSKKWIKYALWVSWLALFFVMMGEHTGWMNISRPFNYIPAGLLVMLHLYNRKYCRCSSGSCCAAD